MLKYDLDAAAAESLDPSVQSLYTKTDSGTFRLNVEGVVSQTEFDNVRNFKNKLLEESRAAAPKVKELETFKSLFGGDATPEAVTGKIETLVQQRAGEMKQAYETQIGDLTTQLTASQSRLEQIVLSDTVKSLAIKAGVADTALDDIEARARSTFKVVNGQLESIDSKLDVSGKPLTPEAWISSLTEKAPHLFVQSTGGGATKPKSVSSIDEDSARSHYRKVIKQRG